MWASIGACCRFASSLVSPLRVLDWHLVRLQVLLAEGSTVDLRIAAEDQFVRFRSLTLIPV